MYIGYSRPGSTEVIIQMLSKMPSEGYDGLQLKGPQYSPWLDDPDAFAEKFDVSRIMGVIPYGPDGVSSVVNVTASDCPAVLGAPVVANNVALQA